MKSQVQYSKTEPSSLLIHLSCQILKIYFTAKANLCVYVSLSVCLMRYVQKSTGSSSHDNADKFQIVSVMSTDTCQTFFIINPQVVFKMYNR